MAIHKADKTIGQIPRMERAGIVRMGGVDHACAITLPQQRVLVAEIVPATKESKDSAPNDINRVNSPVVHAAWPARPDRSKIEIEEHVAIVRGHGQTVRRSPNQKLAIEPRPTDRRPGDHQRVGVGENE